MNGVPVLLPGHTVPVSERLLKLVIFKGGFAFKDWSSYCAGLLKSQPCFCIFFYSSKQLLEDSSCFLASWHSMVAHRQPLLVQVMQML